MQKRGKISLLIYINIQFFVYEGTPVNRIPIMAKHVLDLCKYKKL